MILKCFTLSHSVRLHRPSSHAVCQRSNISEHRVDSRFYVLKCLFDFDLKMSIPVRFLWQEIKILNLCTVQSTTAFVQLDIRWSFGSVTHRKVQYNIQSVKSSHLCLMVNIFVVFIYICNINTTKILTRRWK